MLEEFLSLVCSMKYIIIIICTEKIYNDLEYEYFQLYTDNTINLEVLSKVFLMAHIKF